MAIALPQEYRHVSAQLQSFNAQLNELKQLRERSTVPQLIQQAERVNHLVQDLLATQQSLCKSILKLNYGKNYQVGQTDRPYHQMILTYGKSEKLLSVELETLERLHRTQNFPFQPCKPWFFTRWTSAIRTTGARIGNDIAILSSPLVGAVRFSYSHPFAITAATTGLITAGCLALCKPETASNMLERVLPSSIQSTLSNSINTDSAILRSAGYTSAMYATSAVAGTLSAVSTYFGVREPVSNACAQTGHALTFARQHPGKATANTLHAVVWDIPAGTLKLGYHSAAGTFNTLRSAFRVFGTYSKDALWIAPVAAAGATLVAHAQGKSSKQLALISAGTVTAHLVLKSLHTALTR